MIDLRVAGVEHVDYGEPVLTRVRGELKDVNSVGLVFRDSLDGPARGTRRGFSSAARGGHSHRVSRRRCAGLRRDGRQLDIKKSM